MEVMDHDITASFHDKNDTTKTEETTIKPSIEYKLDKAHTTIYAPLIDGMNMAK